VAGIGPFPVVAVTAIELIRLDPQAYVRHEMHASERIWTETNCYIDVWVEVLHALGLDPMAAAGCAFSADFQGDQWLFLKFPPEDLRALYGIDVAEMNVWRGVIDHVVEQLQAGRFMTIEVDSWFLPDTAGVSYRIDHTKSTIVVNSIDADNQRLGYFHNAGYYELSGEDFDGVFRLGEYTSPTALPPYAELVRLEAITRDPDALVRRSVALAGEHLDRAPTDNPIVRLAARVAADTPWLASSDAETFHLWSFGILRQCGLTAELAASYLQWLSARAVSDFTNEITEFTSVAETAKSVQFRMARLARGRAVDVSESLTSMAGSWEAAMRGVQKWHEHSG
jgi:hypothetical protein